MEMVEIKPQKFFDIRLTVPSEHRPQNQKKKKIPNSSKSER